jgi:hypothetical protein
MIQQASSGVTYHLAVDQELVWEVRTLVIVLYATFRLTRFSGLRAYGSGVHYCTNSAEIPDHQTTRRRDCGVDGRREADSNFGSPDTARLQGRTAIESTAYLDVYYLFTRHS